MKKLIVVLCAIAVLAGCKIDQSATKRDTEAVNRQQGQYSATQPVPVYDWSLERDLLIQLYNIRNMKAATHSVWRSDRGMIEGDCASIGFGMPYDTSLTNPLMGSDLNQHGRMQGNGALVTIEQAEPNGLYASKNTSATWIMCAGTGGVIEPVYIETKVTVYPYPVSVNYETNRVVKSGKASVTIQNNSR